jgi:hypothetical protein
MTNCHFYFVFLGLSDPGDYINSNGKDVKYTQFLKGKKLRGWEVYLTAHDHVQHRTTILVLISGVPRNCFRGGGVQIQLRT